MCTGSARRVIDRGDLLMSVRRNVLAAAAAPSCWAVLALAAPGGAMAATPAAQPGCSAAAPANSAPAPATWASDQDIVTAFSAARTAEGCTAPFTLPAGYDSMSPQQQVQALINSEREVRGLPDLNLDTTLIGQIAQNHALLLSTYGINGDLDPWGDFFADIITNDPALEGPYDPPAQSITDQVGMPVSEAVYDALYENAPGWSDRAALLNATYNYIGVGTSTPANGQTQNVFDLADTAMWTPNYAPPATADTAPPVIGTITYANGMASAVVTANPASTNAANLVTVPIVAVDFYTDNLAESPGDTFNTVAGAYTATNTDTAQIPFTPGTDVLHVLTEDGSANFADVAMAPPAMTLTAGANTVALPAGQTAAATANALTAARAMTARTSAAPTLAATPSAKALVASIDRQAGRRVVRSVSIFVDGRYRTYIPGKSADFPLYTSDGVIVTLSAKVSWRPTTRQEPNAVPTIHLHHGWNFVAVPYPVTGMTCHAVRYELAHLGDRLEQITVGPSPSEGVIMRPVHGHWGNDITKHIPYGKGFWIKDAGQGTWIPSPTQYTR